MKSIYRLLFVICPILCDDFMDAPGEAIEYKVHIDPQKEDCYWQFVHSGATIYINMQVLKGGDGNAALSVRNEKNEVVLPHAWQQSAEYEGNAESDGYYTICIDNQFSKFAGKLVNLYITTFRYDLWENYTQTMEEVELGVNDFMSSINKLEHNVQQIRHYQSFSRGREGRDYQLMIDNNAYIYYWSMVQCLAIVLSSYFQVFSVKKLFQNTSTTKSGLKA